MSDLDQDIDTGQQSAPAMEGAATATGDDLSAAQVFQNVGRDTWDCVKATTQSGNGTVYAPPGADQGTATTGTLVGTVVLGFRFDPGARTVSYTVEQKPWLVPVSAIWSGIQQVIDGCRGR